MRVLILGGTTEASHIARRLADDARFTVTYSLAGRTAAPASQPVATRVGGFGGVDGLGRFLRDHGIEAVIDATHPYADQMSRNAHAACDAAGVALVQVVRPPWMSGDGDCWIDAADADDAVTKLGAVGKHVFLSMGRLELAAFAAAPQHSYVARTIDPPSSDVALPPVIRFITARGPFGVDAEIAMLKDHRIEIIVSKNSGGDATYAKIAAAQQLHIPVIMLARPATSGAQTIAGAADALDWLDARYREVSRHDVVPGSRRGV